MQALAGQWFPPPVSMSQYGVGRWGWVFSLWVVSFSLAPVLLEQALPHRSMLTRVLLLLGLTGTIVMAIVRTDAGGAQVSLNAKIHMAGSIFCMAFLPLGMLSGMWRRGVRWRWLGIAEAGFVAVTMALLLFAAAGYDTAGLSASRSWAFWQAVAVVGCLAMVGSFAVMTRRAVVPPMSDHTLSNTPRSAAGF